MFFVGIKYCVPGILPEFLKEGNYFLFDGKLFKKLSNYLIFT